MSKCGAGAVGDMLDSLRSLGMTRDGNVIVGIGLPDGPLIRNAVKRTAKGVGLYKISRGAVKKYF